MAVVFIDGFDMHRYDPGDTLPGSDDAGQYWYTPPTSAPRYEEGYITGRAIRQQTSQEFGIRGGRASTTNGINSVDREMRAYFMLKATTSPSGSGGYMAVFAFEVRVPNSSDIRTICIQSNNAGAMRLTEGGSYPSQDNVTEVLGSFSHDLDDEWVPCELYVNLTTSTVTARVGSQTLGPFLTETSLIDHEFVGYLFNRPVNFNTEYDHLIITDGEALGVGKKHAMVVTAVADRFETNNGAFRGAIVIGNQTYYAGLDTPRGSSKSPYMSDNAASVIYWVYPENPATNEPWESFNDFDAWGVCVGRMNGVDFIRLAGLRLSVVTTELNTQPLIQQYLPNGLAYYSGKWIKKNPSLSMAGHLITAPRPTLIEDTDYVTTRVDGCILFHGLVDDPVMTELGVTFAEEYREDFVDWALVDVGGHLFDSYFITGYTILGESNKKFQSNYITLNYESSNNGGAYFQAVWDYAMDPATNRWGTLQQIYTAPSGNYKHQMRRLKARGHGRSLQIRISSQDNKDFKINGWAITASGNTSV